MARGFEDKDESCKEMDALYMNSELAYAYCELWYKRGLEKPLLSFVAL